MIYTRNRRHFRKAADQTSPDHSYVRSEARQPVQGQRPYDHQETTNWTMPSSMTPTTVTSASPTNSHQTLVKTTITRSGRNVKPPERLDL